MGERTAEQHIWDMMVELHRELKGAKPLDRNEVARRYAVTITELEKVMSYFNTMVMQEFEG